MKFSSREWGCVWGLCVCSNFLWCNYSILIFQLFFKIFFLSSTNGHVLVVVWHYLCYSLCTEYSVPNPHLIHKYSTFVPFCYSSNSRYTQLLNVTLYSVSHFLMYLYWLVELNCFKYLTLVTCMYLLAYEIYTAVMSRSNERKL